MPHREYRVPGRLEKAVLRPLILKNESTTRHPHRPQTLHQIHLWQIA